MISFSETRKFQNTCDILSLLIYKLLIIIKTSIINTCKCNKINLYIKLNFMATLFDNEIIHEDSKELFGDFDML